MPFYSAAYLASLPDAKRRSLIGRHVLFGYEPTTHDDLYIPRDDRYMGTYALGRPGYGKSGLLQNCIASDIAAGEAVIVEDPHGDLIDACLHYVPPMRLKDTYLLDMEDEAYPFGVNLFNTGDLHTDMERSAAVARIEHIFEILWDDVLKQVGLPRYLRMAILVFLANPGKTLVNMYDFFVDDAFRRQMLQAVTDPTVTQFWHVQYDTLPPSTRLSKVQPLLGRLEQLFAGRSLVRNILGQSQSKIDFRKAIEQKQIIFIKLPVKQAEQDARLIGTILLAQIHAAIFSFGDIAPDKRPGVSLYMDELQNFATTDIGELFTEGRKFGMRLTIAHQYREQLTASLRGATMTAHTKVCFALTPKDSSEMAHEFPAPEGTVKPEHVDPHATETLMNHPHLHPDNVQVFIESYLRTLAPQHVGSYGNKVKLRDLGVDAWDAFSAVVNKMPTPYEVEIESPIVPLDYLLQQIMVTGLYQAPIPPQAVRGFANCGITFWQKVRFLRADDPLLSADIPGLNIPGYLLGVSPDGNYCWLRDPENGTEQLLHFLFHLRVTMRYLAEHPLGTRSTVSTAEVGKMLNSLPKRAAFVRSGKTVGTIYTHQTPKHLSNVDYDQWVRSIRAQTRLKYCRPKAEVEQALFGPSSTQTAAPPPPAPVAVPQPLPSADTATQPSLSGWEEAE